MLSVQLRTSCQPANLEANRGYMGYMSDQQKIRCSENSEKKHGHFQPNRLNMAMLESFPPQKKSEVFNVTWPCCQLLFLDALQKATPVM